MNEQESRQVFLSYAREDIERVKALARVLQSQMWSVWQDVEDLEIGAPYREDTQSALDSAACVVVVWSAEISFLSGMIPSKSIG